MLLVSAAAIPLSLAAAAVVLHLRDVSINFMVVAGLVLGLTAVIHDVIADLHGVAGRLPGQHGDGDGASTWTKVVSASVATRGAVLYAVLIVAAAAIPLLFLRGEGGAFLPPILLSYLLAVAASMLVALTVTPVLAYMLLANAPLHARSVFAGSGRLRQGYDGIAPRLVTRTGAAVAVAAVVAVIGLVSALFLDTSLRPSLKERDVLVHVNAPPGTSLPRMSEITRRAVQDLRSLPGVVNVGGEVGRAVMSDQIVDVNSGELWVKVDPAADYDATVAAIEDTVARYR